MKVLHVSGAKGWGGNEQQLLYLIEELNRYDVDQFIFCYKDTVLLDRIQELKVKITAIDYTKPYKKTYRQALRQTVVNSGVAILHLHTSDSVTGYVVTDLMKCLRVKTVFSKKGISRKISLLSKYKYNYKNIHKVLCVSKVVKDHFEEVLYKRNHHKLCVVHDGVRIHEKVASRENLKTALNISEATLLIGNIANHTRAKDLETLIRMLHVLVYTKNQKNIHLVQVGEFTKRTEVLKELVSELKLGAYVSFLNFKKNASEFLPQFDLYVMTSEREGGPTTVLEAFYKKVPVVSTAVGIVKEAIENEINGFYTPVGDYIALAEKVNILLENKEQRDLFASLSYDKFKSFYTAKILGKKTFEAYKDIV